MPSRAQEFHALHRGPSILILPNAWDAISARVIETAGAKAIATSSAAVAWAHGYGDGHHLPFERLLQTASDIVRVVKVPVTCDCEGGYSDDPLVVASHVSRLIDAGVVGINLEDGRSPHDLHLRKIEAVRAAAAKAGLDLFINARTDVFLKGLVPEPDRMAEVLRRAKAIRAAGASGYFVPFLMRPDDIKTLAAELPLPLNIMGWKGVPKAVELQTLGARRLSAATNIARAAWKTVADAAKAYLHDGDSELLSALGDPGADYNALIHSV